jgi:hypothetical protein
MFTRLFLALALLGCLAAATEPPFNNLRKKKNRKKRSGTAQLHVDVEIKGLNKDPSPNETAMIDDAVKLAFNNGHKDSDYDMIDVVNEKIWVEPDVYVLFDSQADDEDVLFDSQADNEDSSLTRRGRRRRGYGNFFVQAMLKYSCQFCRDDYAEEDASAAALMQFELTGPPKISSADEKEICELLRNTGVKNFAAVHHCSVKLVYKPEEDSAFDLTIAAE